MLIRAEGDVGRVIRGVGSLLVLVALLFGVPWIILEWGAWDTMAHLVQSESFMLHPDDGSLLLVVLTLVGAVFWLILVGSVAVEAVSWVKDSSSPVSGSGGGWSRRLVRPLVGAVFAAVLANGGAGTLLAMGDSDVHGGMDVGAVSVEAPLGGEDETNADAKNDCPSGASRQARPGEALLHVVERGDSLWSIAVQYYGDGTQWVRIAQANSGLITGSVDSIHVGWTLVIPETPGQEEGGSASDEGMGEDQAQNTDGRVVVVRSGDSLWSIASAELGDPMAWTQIYALNQDLIKNPDIIHPGWTLKLPETAERGADDCPHSEEDADASTAGTSVGGGEGEGAEGPEAHEEGGQVVGGETQIDEGEVQASESTAEESGKNEEQGDARAPITSEESSAFDTGLVSGMGVLIAGGVTVLLRRRREEQLRARPVGRRIPQPSTAASRLENAFGMLGDKEPGLSEVDHPDVTATLEGKRVAVSVGRNDDGHVVVADLEHDSPFVIQAVQEKDVIASMTALCLGLAEGAWSPTVELHVVSTNTGLFTTFDNVVCHGSVTEAMNVLRGAVQERRQSIAGHLIEDLRMDPDRGEAYRPLVFAFLDPSDPVDGQELADHLAPPGVGVSALVGRVEYGDQRLFDRGVSIDGSRRATLYPSGLSLTPSLLDHHDLLADLLSVASTYDTTTAWWSSHAPSQLTTNQEEIDMLPVISTLGDTPTAAATNHPMLMLLGPMSLEGARGVPPPRAERACLEYCCWLLEHPGATSSSMTQSLLVAEGTRRSNMSRLRGWLGVMDGGESYLPEAYSGRIWLAETVTSDWLCMRVMIGGGVEAASADTLLAALQLVRGAPLADAGPGQWHWAEELRTDMVSLIRDAGIVCARKCLTEKRIDDARWAVNKALLAAQEDEMLLCTKIQIEQAAGNRLEVERLIGWVTRNARALGLDLLPETTALLREVVSKHPQLSWRAGL